MEKQKYPLNTALTEVDKILILESAIERPGIEIRQLLLEETGTDIHAHFTRQKMVLIVKQRSELLQVEFCQDMSVFNGHPGMLVFIDETGADRRNCFIRNCLYVGNKFLLLLLCQQKVFTATPTLVQWQEINSSTLFKPHYFHICSHSME